MTYTMPLHIQDTDDDDSNYILIAKIDNVKNVSQLLKAVHFKEECLNIFGASTVSGITTALHLCYAGYGSPLVLILEEGGVLTDCRIKTQETEEVLDFQFSPENVVNKVIMKSEILREAWSDLDMTSEILQIVMSPDKPYFRLSTFGNAGTIHVDYSKDSDMVESFQCTQTQSNRYKISLLKPSLKALIQSLKISIRTDEQGIICLQYMIKTEDEHVCFVEYYCVPDEEVEVGEYE
ncbi:cell cycle checkpoint protein RAD1-like [Limulus polyphemus]|uniref:Cell cycle checkpoint protein RAD1-like n=1 Tax=Limulus polyphemus TaxID=6850 RepID=A0ABM1TMQ5_LIMPO|nr:cell cycle checkpoint protein RAD1-like [Limulus polyphemus]